MFEFGGKVIHVDPWGKLADYSKLPKADLILITHEHQDHLDLDTIKKIKTDKTMVILTKNCISKGATGEVMSNGDTKTVAGIKIEAVPAYNLVHKRDTGQPFHPKGEGNGYVLTFGDKKVYVAGDTENTPEMKAMKGIDVAFLPMNLPYTMTPEMVADAAKAFKPKDTVPIPHRRYGPIQAYSPNERCRWSRSQASQNEIMRRSVFERCSGNPFFRNGLLH